MLVLVIGDSHVDNLGSSGPDYFEYRSQRVDIEYYGIRGATFQTYTKNGNDELLNVAGKYQPSIVVTFIGGNAIKTAVSNEKIFEQSERFHRAISEIFPGALVVSSQIEKREYKPGNKYWCVHIFNTHTNATEAPLKAKILRGRALPPQPSVGALPWTPFG